VTTNPGLIETIEALKEASRSSGQAVWRALAEGLDSSKRRRVSVNLSRIDRNTGEGDVVAVPGKVLSSGGLTHPVTVAAFQFSGMAQRKIELAGGRAIGLRELLGEGVEPSEIKILK